MARLKLESCFFDITHPCLGCGKDKEQKRLHRWILALSSQTKSMPSNSFRLVSVVYYNFLWWYSPMTLNIIISGGLRLKAVAVFKNSREINSSIKLYFFDCSNEHSCD